MHKHKKADILTNLEGRHTIDTRRSKEYLPSPQQATLEPYPSYEGSFNVCLSHPPIKICNSLDEYHINLQLYFLTN
jgi:hypothetical protein